MTTSAAATSAAMMTFFSRTRLRRPTGSTLLLRSGELAEKGSGGAAAGDAEFD
jgi:hypothetical protein